MRQLVLVLLTFLLITASSALAGVGIHTIIVGDKTLAVLDNRQLTFHDDGKVEDPMISPDGKTVAFVLDNDARRSFCLVNSSGGKVTEVLKATSEEQGQEGAWIPQQPLAWSPNSKYIVVVADRNPSFPTQANPDEEDDSGSNLLILASNGAYVRGMHYPTDSYALSAMFSPDSQSLAVVYSVGVRKAPRGPVERHDRVLYVYGVTTGSSRVVYQVEGTQLEILNWDREFITCAAGRKPGETDLLHVYPDGRPAEVVQKKYSAENLSSDGRYRLLSERDVVAVQEVQSGKRTEMARDTGVEAQGFLPNPRFVSYARQASIHDNSGKRSRTLRTLWIADIASAKSNDLCVALDAQAPSWSKDCMNVAYTSLGRLYVAQLSLRAPTIDEKIAAGLPLTEQEEKQVLMTNGKAIGNAMAMYRADYNEQLPPNFEDLYEYASCLDLDDEFGDGKRFFCRPGTDNLIFRYESPYDPKADLGTLIVGSLDAGYGWKIIIYADGHVKCQPKDER